jgi:transposase
VPAKLAARVRVYSQGHGRKSDADDAISIGLAALNSTRVAVVRRDDTLVSLRLLCDRRDELGGLRTQAVCRLHRLLCELTPGGTHRGLRASRAEQLLAKLRPVDPVDVVRCQLAHQHLDDIRALDAKMTAVRAQIAALVDVTGTRRLNHALHMMAVTQIRQPETIGRRYYERKRLEGKTPKEAMRCLKRRLSDVVYRQLVADRRATIATCASPTTPTRTPSTSTSATIPVPCTAPPRRPPHPTVSTGSSHSTGKTAASSASKSSTPAVGSPKTSSTKQKTRAEATRKPRTSSAAVPDRRPTSAAAAGITAGAATQRARP